MLPRSTEIQPLVASIQSFALVTNKSAQPSLFLQTTIFYCSGGGKFGVSTPRGKRRRSPGKLGFPCRATPPRILGFPFGAQNLGFHVAPKIWGSRPAPKIWGFHGAQKIWGFHVAPKIWGFRPALKIWGFQVAPRRPSLGKLGVSMSRLKFGGSARRKHFGVSKSCPGAQARGNLGFPCRATTETGGD